MTTRTVPRVLRAEWPLAGVAATAVVFLLVGEALGHALSSPPVLASVFVWLFLSIMTASLAVVRHAEHLAHLLGEPYGTLILTLSITVIEVASISAVMLHGANNPTLARDTLFAVVMIILNGMVGLSLLLGAWRHREQHYNLQGANAYLSVILPLSVLGLVLPDLTQTTAGPTLSLPQQGFLMLVSVGLYATFLAVQTGRHRAYFVADEAAAVPRTHAPRRERVAYHMVFLVAYLGPVVYLAEHLARPVDYFIETLGAPAPLGGVIIALLVATPEAIGAVRAALANQLQRAVNIFLGSILSTIGLTIPAMLLASQLIGRQMVLGVEHSDMLMLLLTLAVSILTFSSGRTNVIQGAVHMILFAAYVLLTVQN